MVPTTIQIEQDEYMELFRAAAELRALEEAGVDNWDYYSEVDWDQVEREVEAEEEAIRG